MAAANKQGSRVHFNCSTVNTGSTDIAASYTASLTTPLFKRVATNSTEIAIERLQVPTKRIPLTRRNIPFRTWSVAVGQDTNSLKQEWVPQFNPKIQSAGFLSTLEVINGSFQLTTNTNKTLPSSTETSAVTLPNNPDQVCAVKTDADSYVYVCTREGNLSFLTAYPILDVNSTGDLTLGNGILVYSPFPSSYIASFCVNPVDHTVYLTVWSAGVCGLVVCSYVAGVNPPATGSWPNSVIATNTFAAPDYVPGNFTDSVLDSTSRVFLTNIFNSPNAGEELLSFDATDDSGAETFPQTNLLSVTTFDGSGDNHTALLFKDPSNNDVQTADLCLQSSGAGHKVVDVNSNVQDAGALIQVGQSASTALDDLGAAFIFLGGGGLNDTDKALTTVQSKAGVLTLSTESTQLNFYPTADQMSLLNSGLLFGGRETNALYLSVLDSTCKGTIYRIQLLRSETSADSTLQLLPVVQGVDFAPLATFPVGVVPTVAVNQGQTLTIFRDLSKNIYSSLDVVAHGSTFSFDFNVLSGSNPVAFGVKDFTQNYTTLPTTAFDAGFVFQEKTPSEYVQYSLNQALGVGSMPDVDTWNSSLLNNNRWSIAKTVNVINPINPGRLPSFPFSLLCDPNNTNNIGYAFAEVDPDTPTQDIGVRIVFQNNRSSGSYVRSLWFAVSLADLLNNPTLAVYDVVSIYTSNKKIESANRSDLFINVCSRSTWGNYTTTNQGGYLIHTGLNTTGSTSGVISLIPVWANLRKALLLNKASDLRDACLMFYGQQNNSAQGYLPNMQISPCGEGDVPAQDLENGGYQWVEPTFVDSFGVGNDSFNCADIHSMAGLTNDPMTTVFLLLTSTGEVIRSTIAAGTIVPPPTAPADDCTYVSSDTTTDPVLLAPTNWTESAVATLNAASSGGYSFYAGLAIDCNVGSTFVEGQPAPPAVLVYIRWQAFKLVGSDGYTATATSVFSLPVIDNTISSASNAMTYLGTMDVFESSYAGQVAYAGFTTRLFAAFPGDVSNTYALNGGFSPMNSLTVNTVSVRGSYINPSDLSKWRITSYKGGTATLLNTVTNQRALVKGTENMMSGVWANATDSFYSVDLSSTAVYYDKPELSSPTINLNAYEWKQILQCGTLLYSNKPHTVPFAAVSTLSLDRASTTTSVPLFDGMSNGSGGLIVMKGNGTLYPPGANQLRTLSYSGNPTLFATTLLPALSYAFLPMSTFDSGEYHIWSVQEYLEKINTALALAFTAAGFAEGIVPPVLTYNSETRFFSLNVDTSFASGINGVVAFNTRMQDIFRMPLYNSELVDARYYPINVKSIFNPSGTATDNARYYAIRQEGSSMQNLWDFKRIVIRSISLPVTGDIESNSQLNAITDVSVDTANFSVNGDLIYLPYFLRIYTLEQNQSVNNLNIEFWYEDRSEVRHQLFMAPSDACSFKLVFVRRSNSV